MYVCTYTDVYTCIHVRMYICTLVRKSANRKKEASEGLRGEEAKRLRGEEKRKEKFLGRPLVHPGPQKSSRADFRHFKSGQVEKSYEAKTPIPAYLQWIVTRRSEAVAGPRDPQQPPKK